MDFRKDKSFKIHRFVLIATFVFFNLFAFSYLVRYINTNYSFINEFASIVRRYEFIAASQDWNDIEFRGIDDVIVQPYIGNDMDNLIKDKGEGTIIQAKQQDKGSIYFFLKENPQEEPTIGNKKAEFLVADKSFFANLYEEQEPAGAKNPLLVIMFCLVVESTILGLFSESFNEGKGIFSSELFGYIFSRGFIVFVSFLSMTEMVRYYPQQRFCFWIAVVWLLNAHIQTRRFFK